ncbi:MAG: SAM-dependent methyltransferase [Blastocatellia bacterium AA13]|nr:MAG: SAM-dependent methyltransferase [Blastocatellia bacterium AA13]
MNDKWYENFFKGIVLDMWRKALPPEHTRAELDFLTEKLGLTAGMSVLDVPCGAGRHGIEIASRGMQVTGVDFSGEMIAEARANAAAAGVEAEWREADMRDLPWEGRFDAAYCFGNAFGYLDSSGTRAFLGAVGRALKTGAKFIVDSGQIAECVLPNLKEREWARVDDIYFLEENRYDIEHSYVETTYTFIRDGKADSRVGIHWVYTIREVREMFDQAGFDVLSLYSSISGDEFRPGSTYIIIIARKR